MSSSAYCVVRTEIYYYYYLLTPWSSVLVEKLTVSQSRSSLHFMEPDDSLPHLQVPATWPYPEPDRSSPCSPSHFLKIHLNIIIINIIIIIIIILVIIIIIITFMQVISSYTRKINHVFRVYIIYILYIYIYMQLFCIYNSWNMYYYFFTFTLVPSDVRVQCGGRM